MTKTPITDRRAFFADNRVGNTVLVVETETARQLELMCEELAETLATALAGIEDGMKVLGVTTPPENAAQFIGHIKSDLTKWQAMKEGK